MALKVSSVGGQNNCTVDCAEIARENDRRLLSLACQFPASVPQPPNSFRNPTDFFFAGPGQRPRSAKLVVELDPDGPYEVACVTAAGQARRLSGGPTTYNISDAECLMRQPLQVRVNATGPAPPAAASCIGIDVIRVDADF